jgi:phosphoglucomutase
MGVLLLDYVARLTGEAEGAEALANKVAVTTIVSSVMVDSIAKEYGFEMRRVLTGFKYIGGVIAELEAEGHPERFVFGFEESYGYLAGTYVRDKDAVVASMLICQMARYYRTQGKNLYQAMQELYARYGYHHNRTLSFTFEGITGAKRMASIMEDLRADAPTSIAGFAVEQVRDYQQGIDGLEKANVVEFCLAGGNKAIVRPSGTEPKIKVYVFSVGQTDVEASDLNQAIGDAMAQLMQ